MRVLAVDTGSLPGKRGYAVAQSGELTWWGKVPPEPYEAFDWFVTEVPFPGGKSRGKGFVTLCVNNGFQLRDLGEACGAPRYGYAHLPVRDWKNALIPGRANVSKDVFSNLIKRDFAPDVSDVEILDACGMAIVASRMSMKQLQKYYPKGFRL